MDLRAHQSGRYPGATTYSPTARSPKKIKNGAYGTEPRPSNNLPEKTVDVPHCQTYDVQSKYGYVNVKNHHNEMALLKKILKSQSNSPLNSPKKRSTSNLDLDNSANVAYATKVNNLPQLKTNYRIVSGLIGKEPRKCSQF